MDSAIGSTGSAGSNGFDPAEYGEHIADVYDDWHGDRDDLPPIVDFLAGLAAGRPALELGIGTGRIALPLAARGVRVDGIDSSPRMVAKLRAKPGGGDLDVAIGDFAGVDAPGGSYGLIYIPFNTFFALLTQDDQVRCFAGVAARLVPGGVFVLEGFVPDLTRYDRGQTVKVEAFEAEFTRFGARTVDLATQRIRSRQFFVRDSGITTYPVEMRYAWPSELDLMARLAGLTLQGRWQGWKHEPFTSASPSHVSVWQARAPQ